MNAPYFRGTLTFLCMLGAACGGGATEPSGVADPPGSGPPAEAPLPIAKNPTGDPSGAGAGTGAGTGTGTGVALTAAKCFEGLTGKVAGPDYDQFKPVLSKTCLGTHHQDIKGVQKLVFLGDSITEGTPPSLPAQFYRSILTEDLRKKFGASLEVKNCAAWGARMDDLLEGKKEIAECFPAAVEPKRTLVVMTMGGNDISNWAKDKLDAKTAIAEADKAVALLRAAMVWLKKDPKRFPAGVDVVLTNVYEYTDTTGDLMSCPTAAVSGMSGRWAEGAPAVVHFQEQIMKVAVDVGIDMVFLLEDFCGHGFKNDDPKNQCYRGPNTPRWFDLTCIHPNPAGHAEIARLFRAVIDG